MTDAERALQVLIHDVRTPLGVAHGYVRMLREHRLPAPEDQERALRQTQDALVHLSRLCEEASAFMTAPTPGAEVVLPAGLFAVRLERALRERNHGLLRPDLPEAWLMRTGSSLDRLAEATARILAPTSDTSGDVGLLADGTWMRVAADGAGTLADAAEGSQTFDPWQRASLSLVVAHRIVTGVGGRVHELPTGALVVVFPLETASV
ncbi:MAG: histidine kinase dimerization/phospho-acceptor domain-containing protein [Acidobacteriota bacterium]